MKAPTVWRRKERVLNRFGLGTLSIYGQFRNKITFYPVIEGAYVNTKNWYREETDMWAKFGRRAPFGRRFSSKHSVEALRSGVHRHSAEELFHGWKRKAFGNAWWRGLNIRKGMNWWWIRDRHDAMVLNLSNKCCNRGRLGVVLGPGYKYKPLVFVIGIEQFHNKPARANFRVILVESSSSSRGAIDPSTSVSTGNLVSCLVSCGGFRPWCK
jgi:hypothetical protein